MVGASSRLLFLFTGPISLLHRRPFSLFGLARRHSLTFPLPTLSVAPHQLLPLSRRNSLVRIGFSKQFYSRPASDALQENNHIHARNDIVLPSHPWPEWSRLLESLSIAGYFNGISNIEDEFVANENLSMEFVAAARSCMGFARDRPDILGLLPRKDIVVLLNDGSPFLFKSALETERRMGSFLQAEGSEEARTVDLMKYILSHASNPIIYPERNIKEATESSVRNLLQEMANLSCRGQASEQLQPAGRDEHMPRNLGPNITMKRGDWICPRCSFMNFARNAKCLECEELRPQRQLTGGEWDCPRCNFFNYRRNVVCLKCECRRPGDQSPGSLGQGKTPFNKQLIGSRYQNDFGDTYMPGGNNFGSVDHNLDHFPGNASTVAVTCTKSSNKGQNDRKDGPPPMSMGSNSSYVPFVPLTADMLAKKPGKMTNEHSEEAAMRSSELPKAGDDSKCSGKAAINVGSRQIKDADEEDKSERWFKKVKELHGVRDTASAILDEDFPQIMPIRKGEDRFVVSKKKDQPFSPQQRQHAINQGSGSSFVPFVPFPPDYFANKGDQQQPKSIDSTTKPNNEFSSSHSHGNLNTATHNKNLMEGTRIQQMSSGNNLDSRSSIGNGGLFSVDTNACSSNNQFRPTETRPETSNVGQQTPSGWTGKSLEGSAVTEPDPLDMSEEAKAERWFRRVAQIKDISELSQIPDEDFPSIMPMRKGVNRFVVSKRKTPLERRLTSPQYRKNLRIMSSDPMKKEGDNDS